MQTRESQESRPGRHAPDGSIVCAALPRARVVNPSNTDTILHLKDRLAEAGQGRMLLLQMLGSAAESMPAAGSAAGPERLHDLESVSHYLAFMSGKPVLPVVPAAASGEALRGHTGEPAPELPCADNQGRFEIFTSRRCEDSGVEESVVRGGGGTAGFYASSAHLLWLEGGGTSNGCARLESLGRISNPIGIRVGQLSTAQDLLWQCRLLNPDREAGKIVLATELGKSLTALQDWIRVLRDARVPVVWICDLRGSGGVSLAADAAVSIGNLTAELERTAAVHAEGGSLLAGMRLSARLDYLQTLRVCSDFARACAAKE